MKEDFVTYNLAVKLKEKGFDWACMAHFNTITYNEPTLNYNVTVDDIRGSNFKSLNKLDSFIDAPTISQVLKWLREEKNIEAVASFSYRDKEWGYQVGDMNLSEDSILAYDYSFPTYEEAILAGIEYVLNNLL